MKTDEDIVDWIHFELAECVDNRLNDWRTNASTDYDYYAGNQWKSILTGADHINNDMEQDTVTFNRVARTVNAITGLEQQNRRQIKFYPRRLGTAGVSEYMTSAGKWARDHALSEHEESEAFQDLAICGVGVTQYLLDADGPEPEIKQERVDPLEVLWDYRAKRRNLTDSKWRARLRLLSEEELMDAWPSANATLAGKGRRYLDYPAEPHDSTPPRYDQEQDPQRSVKGYEVIEFEYWTREQYYQVLGPTGQLEELKLADFKKIRPYLDANGIRYGRRRKKVFQRIVLSGMQVLEKKPGLLDQDFTIRIMTGLRDRNKNNWFGMVSLMRDPQRWSNKWLTQMLHTMNANAKGGLLAETDAFESITQAEDSWAYSDKITWLKSGGLQKIQEKTFAQLPASTDRLLQYALEAISSTSGVNVEMLGLADRDQAGVVEDARKRAGITMVATFFEAQQIEYKCGGKIIMELVRKYIADGRLFRLFGPEGESYVPLVKDDLDLEHDVIVDDAPDSPDIRDKTFAVAMQIIPMALQAGIPVPPEILEYAPLPQDLILKWKQKLQPQQPDPEQVEAKQRQKAMEEATIADLQATAQNKAAQAGLKVKEFELDTEKLKMQGMQAGFEAQLAKQRFEHETAMKELEKQIEFGKLELAATQAGFDSQIKKQDQEFEKAKIELEQQHNIRMAALEGMKTLEKLDESDIFHFKQLQSGFEEHSRTIADIINAVGHLGEQIKKPRKRTLVRDKNGRATHAIEVVVEPDDSMMH